MRTDALDLEISDTRIRVLCEDRASREFLRAALADHVIDEPAPVGFALQLPDGRQNLHVLLDRSGFILARVKTAEEGLSVLGSHLAALLPPPPNTIRVRARALLRADGATASLAAFPLFVDPPIVERRLERSSYRMVDRMAVDLSPDGLVHMSQTPWKRLAQLTSVAGHSAAPPGAVPIDKLLVPRLGDAEPTHANVVAAIAEAAAPSSEHQERLAIALRLTANPVSSVSVDERSARYAALDR